MKEIPFYNCHKRVQAFKIKEVTKSHPGLGWSLYAVDAALSDVYVPPEWLDKHVPGSNALEDAVGGYYVRYADGYESWSPAETFEAGYTLYPEAPRGSAFIDLDGKKTAVKIGEVNRLTIVPSDPSHKIHVVSPEWLELNKPEPGGYLICPEHGEPAYLSAAEFDDAVQEKAYTPGLEPRETHERTRLLSVIDACTKKINAREKIPVDWADELYALIQGFVA